MHNRRGIKIAEVVGEEVCLRSGQDLLDLLSHLYGTEVERIVLREEQLDPAFFDLRTGLAGDITQKFVNYHLKVAIVGQFEKYSSKALADFIREANQGKQLFFTASVSEALARLAIA
ncbi:MAG: DUF4180 domain-containing protein [Anaerolineae bacterium]|nr:DUF4180 domain-containing protein [Anaerolineae bacterium]